MSLRDSAIELFKKFHHRAPKRGQIALLGMEPEEALLVGKFTRIAYCALDGKEYIHTFNKRNRPHVFVSSDGRQIYILGGGYRFTERGFVG